MNLRAVTIGISAAFLALACSSSGDGGDKEDGETPNPGNTPSGPTTPGDGPTTPGNGPTTTLPDAPEAQDPDTEQDLSAVYVESLLQRSCGKCHGEAAAASATGCRAGMCYIEDVNELITNGKIVPGQPGQSPLYSRITRTDATVMPPPGETPRLSDTEIDQIEQFILRKAPVAAATCTDQFLTWDDVYESIEADLLRQDADDREFIRYITLTDRYNAGVCDQQLEQDRFALNKFINSISTETQVRQAEEVTDPQRSKTIYRIDLRDYGLDDSKGPFIVDNVSFVDGWEAIIGNNNFAVQFQGDQAENVILLSNTLVPVMFSDAIIDEASNGNLYYGLLRLSDNRDQIQADLGLDLAGDLDQDITVRAGTTNSAISQQERLMQRNEQPVGGLYYYESFDLDPNVAGDSIFDNPLEFDQNANGSEAVFSLPNGLQAYAIFDENGLRLEESPILFDNITQNDNVMRVGVSCSNCHVAGLVPFQDQVRDFSIDNQIDAAAAAAAVGQQFEDILDLYPDAADLKRTFDTDSAIFQNALVRAGVPSSQKTDPIAQTFVRFDKDADINVIAGLVGFPAANLAREVNRLDPQLSGLDNGFKIDIDDFKGLYENTLCVVTVANENRPLDQVCIDAGALVQ
jgi:mono/diheme cytochrome c family protein